jgi:hypothetical protein
MDPIFEAVLGSDKTVAQLLKKSPELSQARAGEDHLVETIPHWLYVGDTPLHRVLAARWLETLKTLVCLLCAGLTLRGPRQAQRTKCQVRPPGTAQEGALAAYHFSSAAWYKGSSAPCVFLSLDRVGCADGLFGALRRQMINPVLNAPDQQDISASFSLVENIYKESPD